MTVHPSSLESDMDATKVAANWHELLDEEHFRGADTYEKDARTLVLLD